MRNSVIDRAEQFASEFGLTHPIILGAMAGACPVSVSLAVAKGGGMGACGALSMEPKAMRQWASEFRAETDKPFQMNLWIPDEAAHITPDHESELRTFLRQWGPEASAQSAKDTSPDFRAQCEALIDIAPPVISSIMGLFEASFIAEMKANGIKWFANVTTVEEALMAEAAGADVIVAKGVEAGGHSGAFNPEDALRCGVGTMSLVPAIVDTVDLPVVASGGIADGRTMAASLMLGASAVQIGTGFLRSTESTIASVWANALRDARPEGTIVTRAFSGRAGRSIATDYALAMDRRDSPEPAPYPIQRGLTEAMRAQAKKDNNIDGMQAWAGQSAAMAQADSATVITQNIWRSAKDLLVQ